MELYTCEQEQMRNIIKKKKNVYFSNMKKTIKHYPMSDRLIVIRGYIFRLFVTNFIELGWKWKSIFVQANRRFKEMLKAEILIKFVSI